MNPSERERLQELADKWLRGVITPEEAEEYARWFNQDVDGVIEVPESFAQSEAEQRDRVLQSILALRKKAKVHTMGRVWRWSVAAAVIIALSVGAFYWMNPRPQDSLPPVVAAQTDALPGTYKATLTLSDGQKIDLNNSRTVQDGAVKITNANNELQYTTSDVVVYHTMSTPKGGQYRLILPDHSRVWLNAASSITYPTAFTGATRQVQITGEAYFEVTPNKEKPFIVSINDHTQVEVLGTKFNVNAYADEPVIQTTLLQGSVRTGNRVLKPGEAWINGAVKKVNTAAAVAWKNGIFQFDNADLPTVMRQIGRWYDLTVRFEGAMPSDLFKGDIERDLKLSQMMALLSYMDITYRLENNNVLVITAKH